MVFLFLFLSLFISCTKNTEEVGDVYARVGETILTKKEVLEMKKEGLVEQSSIRHLVESWVEKTLFYNEAVNINLDNDKSLCLFWLTEVILEGKIIPFSETYLFNNLIFL